MPESLADLVKFFSFSVPGPRDPYSQLRAAIPSNLPQELRKIVEIDAAAGLGRFCRN